MQFFVVQFSWFKIDLYFSYGYLRSQCSWRKSTGCDYKGVSNEAEDVKELSKCYGIYTTEINLLWNMTWLPTVTCTSTLLEFQETAGPFEDFVASNKDKYTTTTVEHNETTTSAAPEQQDESVAVDMSGKIRKFSKRSKINPCLLVKMLQSRKFTYFRCNGAKWHYRPSRKTK